MGWDAWGVWLTYEVRCYVVAGVFVIGEEVSVRTCWLFQ
jgi:hypothetical protein